MASSNLENLNADGAEFSGLKFSEQIKDADYTEFLSKLKAGLDFCLWPSIRFATTLRQPVFLDETKEGSVEPPDFIRMPLFQVIDIVSLRGSSKALSAS